MRGRALWFTFHFSGLLLRTSLELSLILVSQFGEEIRALTVHGVIRVFPLVTVTIRKMKLPKSVLLAKPPVALILRSIGEVIAPVPVRLSLLIPLTNCFYSSSFFRSSSKNDSESHE